MNAFDLALRLFAKVPANRINLDCDNGCPREISLMQYFIIDNSVFKQTASENDVCNILKENKPCSKRGCTGIVKTTWNASGMFELHITDIVTP